METEGDKPVYWAVYPYSSTNTCDGQSVTLTVPLDQSGTKGTFADKFFPAVACGDSYSLAFYNVCGGARFSVIQEGVTKVIFKSNDGSPMAGKVKVGFGDDNKPQILELTEPVDSIVVNAPEGGFSPGENYFAAMLPQMHAEGLTVILKQKGKKAEKTLQSNIEIKRSAFGILNNIDEGLEYVIDESEPEVNPEDIIEFADSRIKTHCVAAFDTNGDGELSYAEAAAVTDVSTAFTSTLYTSFDEFRYFTGVTEIPANWFKDRARLKSIALPASITSVGSGAFSGCAAIEKVAVGGKLISTTTMKTVFPSAYATIADWEIIPSGEEYSICANAFDGYIGLASITLPEGLTSVGAGAFNGCNNLTTVNIPSIESWLQITFAQASCSPFCASGEGHLYVKDNEITTVIVPDGQEQIGQYVFYNCVNIAEITFPSSLKTVGKEAFTGCSALTKVNIPSLAAWMDIQFTDSGSAPFNASKVGHLYLKGVELKEPVIPEETTNIKPYAFYYCTGFDKMIFEPTVPPTLGSGALTGTNYYIIVWDECFSVYVSKFANYSYWLVYLLVSDNHRSFVPELVDLGLPSGLKWASFNLGATTPEEYGDYFSWGETLPKSNYNWSTYKWCNGSWNTLTKYCTDSYTGFKDNKTVLDPEDDAATVALGGSWRMATNAEWTELGTKCTWTWTTQNGVKGRLVTGPNGNSIFLPAAGYRDGTSLSDAGSYGYCWSSSLRTDLPRYAYDVDFNSSDVHYSYIRYRDLGQSVRPVTE
jgi:hypothetical protein